MIQTQNLFLKIDNYALIVSNNALIQGAIACRLTADTAATSTALTVDNNIGFVTGDYILIGNIGDSSAEIQQITTIANKTTLTLTGATSTSFAHFRSTVVYRIAYNQVSFLRATTLTGSQSALTTVAINPRTLTTTYQDATNTTGYGFFNFLNSTTSAVSQVSNGAPYTGKVLNSVSELARAGSAMVGLSLDTAFTQQIDLINDVAEAVDIIIRSGDWQFEKTSATVTSITNEYIYDITSLNMKHPGVRKSIFNVYFGANKKLKALSYEEIQQYYVGATKQYVVAGPYVAGSTKIQLDDVTEFSTTGTFYVNGQTIAYTGVNDASNLLTGIPATGTGSIATTINTGDVVLQNITSSEPSKFAIDNSNFIVDRPIDYTLSGLKFKISYLKAQTPVSSMQDVVTIPFYQIIKDYIAYKIETRRKRPDYAGVHSNNFNTKIAQSQSTYMIPTVQEYDYWTFNNSIRQRNLYINDSFDDSNMNNF